MQLNQLLAETISRLKTIKNAKKIEEFARQHRLGVAWCRKLAEGEISNPGILKIDELRRALDEWDESRLETISSGN